MTIADKIRNMTDEGLSNFFALHFDCECCPLSYFDDIYNEIQCGGKRKECHKNLLEWLKQETKGE